jgi:hypothetical protein
MRGPDGECSWLGNEVQEAGRLLQELEVWELSIIRLEANNVSHMLYIQRIYINTYMDGGGPGFCSKN